MVSGAGVKQMIKIKRHNHPNIIRFVSSGSSISEGGC